MPSPRFLTDWGLGHYRGGFPAAGFANDTEMLAQYPLKNSLKLAKVGGAHMLDYLPQQWVYDYYTVQQGYTDSQLLIPFTAAGGAYRVTDARGGETKCPKPELVFSRLAVAGGSVGAFHPTLTLMSDYNGKFLQYNDESLFWYGLYAGVRVKLYDNWANSGLPAIQSYGSTQRDADYIAWQCAIEAVSSVFSYLRWQLPGSKWTIHLVPVRSQRTDAVQVNGIPISDLMYGQSGSGARWTGVGSTGDQLDWATTYAALWKESAKQAYQPIANALDWICPRLYIDDRMRNWDQEVPGQAPPTGWTDPATATLIRESYLRAFEAAVEVSKHIANKKPVYPAVIPFHAGQSNNVTNNTLVQDWYLGLNIDLETHREQMRRIVSKTDGVSFWSSDDYIARECFNIGVAGVTLADAPPGGDVFAAGYTMPNKVKLRVRTQRRFPGVFDHLVPHPSTQAEEDAWRTVENWNTYNDLAIKQVEQMAQSSALLGVLRQSTLNEALSIAV